MNKITFVNSVIKRIEEENILPWRCPWIKYENGDSLPCNFLTKKQYRGINAFWLGIMPYKTPYWLSFNQASKLKGKVRKGEKATFIVYYSTYEKEVEKGDKIIKKHIPFLKTYPVFNIEQCEGIEIPELKPIQLKEHQRLEQCDGIVANYADSPQIINELQSRAFYSPARDYIKMPQMGQFENPEKYYSTLFHELAHSTGHESRLDRKELSESKHFGDENYSKEELIAEMTACFLCSEACIENETIDNSVSYLKGWLRALKQNPDWLINSASAAQKAADYILGKQNQLENNRP